MGFASLLMAEVLKPYEWSLTWIVNYKNSKLNGSDEFNYFRVSTTIASVNKGQLIRMV